MIMDKQGNTYTILYASVMVILVAALLAFVAQVLKPQQTKNIEVAKKMEMLLSLKIESDVTNAEAEYAKVIGGNSYIINSKGERLEGDAFYVDLAKEVVKPIDKQKFPIFECTLGDGSKKYLLPVYGKGLWGPIWGYISLDDDKNTIFGAVFSHKGETPGLGAEIDKPPFQKVFVGKQLFDANKTFVSIQVQKAGANKGTIHEVDAISGGTITSKGVESMLLSCLKGYEQFLKN